MFHIPLVIGDKRCNIGRCLTTGCNWNQAIFFERSFDTCKGILEKSDLIFTLDFNALHRTGDQMENALKTLTVLSVMIDHHQAPDGYATFTFSDTAYGSTCEMVYDLIYQLGYENLINKNVATCLYTGIVTDSGSFRFPKTTSKTHKCVADLIDRGINNSEIHNLLFDNSHTIVTGKIGRAHV